MKNFNEEYPKKPFIIVVDDVAKNLQVIGSILIDEGYDISLASDGREALELLQEELPDLILLDVMMPELSGFDLCKMIKEDDRTKDIPIIFLTAKTETEDIVNGFRIGGEDYITKPFNKEELLARISTHLNLKFSKDKIIEQNSELIKLHEEKNEMLGIAAHDLKNPLNVIKGFTDVMLMDSDLNVNQEYTEYLTLIRNSSEFMLSIIMDLLNVNQIESGQIQVHFNKFNLVSTVKSSIINFEKQADLKSLNLNFECESEVYPILNDEHKVRQITDNLISNAIKFSPFEKNIWIILSKPDNDSYQIEVKDEGPGINEEDMKKLFGKFRKLTARPTNNEHSTGLGLSIVKKLAELLGGTIHCESQPGKGANFILNLPATGNR